jgi:LPXTG-site transpeptidase (sortase) family protein
VKIFSGILIFVGTAILLSIYWPVIREEMKYGFDQIIHVRYSLGVSEEGSFDKPLIVPNTDFSIAIPKIAAVAPVIENVDPLNKNEYLKALKEGVAHAKGTALPGEEGNVYIFAHSTDAFYNVGKYNAVFYLLGKLVKNDEIFIYYKNQLIKYVVDQVKVVSPNDIQYMTKNTVENTLTLQTCYPPGTTIDRLIVIAKQVE